MLELLVSKTIIIYKRFRIRQEFIVSLKKHMSILIKTFTVVASSWVNWAPAIINAMFQASSTHATQGTSSAAKWTSALCTFLAELLAAKSSNKGRGKRLC
jgi:hypothetical protein